MLMVTAGKAVEAVIEKLLPLLDPGDILIDGGNSNYQDSNRRWRELAIKGIHFVGMGVSGGEDGARHGPSLMPGGAAAAWPTIRDMFQSIAAKVDGVPCCQWLGDGGAGHYVKMVHNGIEYGDMQLIAEVCHLMQHALGMSHDEMADTFANWNAGRLESYLIEITSRILRQRDSDGSPLVDKILDRAGQKGTGVWTAQDALDNAVPLTLIGEAVHARMLSARKAERVAAATLLGATRSRWQNPLVPLISMPCAMRSTPPSWFPTRKVSCSCRPPPKPRAGLCPTAKSHCSGGPDASSAAAFSATSRPVSRVRRPRPACCRIPSSSPRSRRRKPAGAKP